MKKFFLIFFLVPSLISAMDDTSDSESDDLLQTAEDGRVGTCSFLVELHPNHANALTPNCCGCYLSDQPEPPAGVAALKQAFDDLDSISSVEHKLFQNKCIHIFCNVPSNRQHLLRNAPGIKTINTVDKSSAIFLERLDQIEGRVTATIRCVIGAALGTGIALYVSYSALSSQIASTQQ